MTPVDTNLLLTLHRDLVAIPSVSGGEEDIAAFAARWLEERGLVVERLERNVIARAGTPGAPVLLWNTHLDTVPPTDAWTRDPFDVVVEEGRVFGLGSNDAKAAAACMMAAAAGLAEGGPVDLWLTLVADEETGGRGTELVWPHLHQRGVRPAGVCVGEPTGLDVATAQKGMLALELVRAGDVCHAANAQGATNAIFEIVKDLTALEGIDLGPPHPALGAASLQPTVLRAGEATNALPSRAACRLDLRTVPTHDGEDVHQVLIARVRSAVEGEVRVVSERLKPVASDAQSAIVQAALTTRPASATYASPTMSDWVFFEGVPGIKCGPGRSARSHRPDEFVEERELIEGAAFYARMAEIFPTLLTREAEA